MDLYLGIKGELDIIGGKNPKVVLVGNLSESR